MRGLAYVLVLLPVHVGLHRGPYRVNYTSRYVFSPLTPQPLHTAF